MDFFAEFNNFQKEIFKNIFANPFQNQSNPTDARNGKEIIKVEQSIQITAKKESPSQRQTTKRKRRASSNFSVDENSNLKDNAKASTKLNKSETRILLEEKSKTLQQVNIYETPRKSFLIPPNEEINGKGVRRGRSKYKNSNSSFNELPAKVFNEMCQEEFLCVFGLKKMI